MKLLKHVGYYNDEEDINILNENKPDVVVDFYKYGYGNFYHTSDEEVKTFNEVKHNENNFTSDGKYFVVFPFDEPGTTIENNSDCFIDIYMVVSDDYEYDGGKCTDTCTYCDQEIELPRKLSVYRCPSCGRWLPNCSMCYLMDNNLCPNNCPLEYEAHRRNKLEGLEE